MASGVVKVTTMVARQDLPCRCSADHELKGISTIDFISFTDLTAGC